MIRSTSIALAALALTGCGLTPASQRTEFAWQSANLIDGVQTSQWQHNDCQEVGAWKAITGPEPTIERTVLATAINAALHYSITYALDRYDAPIGLKRAWAWTTIGLTTGQVVRNATLECAR